MHVLGSLGIDLKLFVAQIINFGLLLLVLSKFLYQPILRNIEKAEAELEQARTANDRFAKLEQQKEAEVKKAKQRARTIVKEAEQIAQDIEERAKKETERERRLVITQIRSRINDYEGRKKKS